MSNKGRPREGMKPCEFCGSTSRDSNGQCSCRNNLYRLMRKVATDIPETFNELVAKGYTPKGARATISTWLDLLGDLAKG